MKKIFTILLLAVLSFTFAGCDHYLDVNKNVDAPDNVEASLYLAGIESSYQSSYFDQLVTGCISMLWMGPSYSNFQIHYYNVGSDTGGNIWYYVFWKQGQNLENMINQSIADKKWKLAGIGLAIKAFSWQELTEEYGDAPMREAYEAGRMSFDYDYQDSIYARVRTWAEDAISYLALEDDTDYGTNLSSRDLIYKGSAEKWTKFAHGVIVRNLISLSNKTDFTSKYAQSLLDHAALSLATSADDATVSVAGGSADAAYDAYNNAYGPYRANILSSIQSDWLVQILTGTIPEYADNGVIVANETSKFSAYHPNSLLYPQITCDTNYTTTGHFDPRMVIKLGTVSDPYYQYVDSLKRIKQFTYYGGAWASASGPIGTAPNELHRLTGVSSYTGTGRWLFRDDAPYILMTAAEIQFDVAETYFKMGQKDLAFTAFKNGVSLDMDFTAKYIVPGKSATDAKGAFVTGGGLPGGDKISSTLFNTCAKEYLAGPYVNGLGSANLTLSHIMMQKLIHCFPWNCLEVWTDMRKYHYDLAYTGDYPTQGNGYETSYLIHKKDTDASKVYKGLYLQPALVDERKEGFNIKNEGAPCYRIRPRYNSEYMWNLPGLNALKPIAGGADNYQCSIPWFAYPNDYPFTR